MHAFAAKHGGIPTHTSCESLLESDLRAVTICSPPAAHADNALRAAEHGLAILCEKPISPTEAEAVAMTSAIQALGVPFYIGFVYRFSPVAIQIRRWIREGVIGEVRSLRLLYLWDLHGQWMPDGNGEWIESPRWRGRMLEGGPMVDCGVHQIDLARWWLGSEVVRTTAAGAWVSEYEAPDHVYVHLDHENGAHTMVEMSFTYGHTAARPRSQFVYELIGTGGVIRFDRDGYVLEILNGSGVFRGEGASEKNFAGMYAEFHRAVETGDPGMMPSASDGIMATRIAREATDAVIAGRHTRGLVSLP